MLDSRSGKTGHRLALRLLAFALGKCAIGDLFGTWMSASPRSCQSGQQVEFSHGARINHPSVGGARSTGSVQISRGLRCPIVLTGGSDRLFSMTLSPNGNVLNRGGRQQCLGRLQGLGPQGRLSRPKVVSSRTSLDSSVSSQHSFVFPELSGRAHHCRAIYSDITHFCFFRDRLCDRLLVSSGKSDLETDLKEIILQ